MSQFGSFAQFRITAGDRNWAVYFGGHVAKAGLTQSAQKQWRSLIRRRVRIRRKGLMAQIGIRFRART